MPARKTARELHPDFDERRKALAEWRRRLGISLQQAGQLLNYHETSVGAMERGKWYVSDYVMQMIAEHEHL